MFRMRKKFQMTWIHAELLPTAMVYMGALGNRTMQKLIGEPMNASYLAGGDSEATVSSAIGRPGPEQAATPVFVTDTAKKAPIPRNGLHSHT